MNIRITNGIKISVVTNYEVHHSQPQQSYYVYSYRVVIENMTNSPVQLLRRHWKIMESNGRFREVEGEGVIGQQPIIPPKKHHQYTSASRMGTDLGKMYGTYSMRRLDDDHHFKVKIPVFLLFPPHKLN